MKIEAEALAIVRELAGLEPEVWDSYSQRDRCFFCGTANRLDVSAMRGERPGLRHNPGCLLIRAGKLRERLDAQPAAVRHIRTAGGHLPIAAALNRKARENPGSHCRESES